MNTYTFHVETPTHVDVSRVSIQAETLNEAYEKLAAARIDGAEFLNPKLEHQAK
jgi:hypothetical protein